MSMKSTQKHKKNIYEAEMYLRFDLFWLLHFLLQSLWTKHHMLVPLLNESSRKTADLNYEHHCFLHICSDSVKERIILEPQGSHGNGTNYYHKTQGTPCGFPHVFSVPQGRQEFLISLETQEKALSIPLSTRTRLGWAHFPRRSKRKSSLSPRDHKMSFPCVYNWGKWYSPGNNCYSGRKGGNSRFPQLQGNVISLSWNQ